VMPTEINASSLFSETSFSSDEESYEVIGDSVSSIGRSVEAFSPNEDETIVLSPNRHQSKEKKNLVEAAKVIENDPAGDNGIPQRLLANRSEGLEKEQKDKMNE
ncbi:hypothetical protein PENTCL1PPCAC_10941, partial [Pristionchus entomophagus]